MPTTLELIGKAVVERGGERIGQVKEVIIDPREVGVLALLVRPGVGGDLALPFESVFELGPRAVVVAVSDDLVPVGRLPRVGLAREQGPQMGRTLLLSSRGLPLGVVLDLHFDPDSGRVTGYEVAASGAPTRVVHVPAQHASFRADGALHTSAQAEPLLAHMARASPGERG